GAVRFSAVQTSFVSRERNICAVQCAILIQKTNYIWSGQCRGIPAIADMGVPEFIDFLGRWEEIAPHPRRRGKLGKATAERLDRQPVVVAQRPERRDRLADARLPLARGAAVVLADVDVAELARGPRRAHRRDRVLFLDIGVE